MSLLDPNIPMDDKLEDNLEDYMAKWKDKPHDELVRAKAESDRYIKTLEAQKDELRQDYLSLRGQLDGQTKLEELLGQLKQRQPSSELPNANDAQDTKPAITSEQIEQLLQNKLNAHEQNKKYLDNANSVKEKLIERYGPNYHNTVKQQIDSLGIDATIFDEMASKHPKVLIKTLGLDQPKQTEDFLSPPRSNQRSESSAAGPGKRTWSYYQKMKTENPKLYFDPKTTVQMHKDAIAQGDSFKDGNWEHLGRL